jgi:hypothetical protein
MQTAVVMHREGGRLAGQPLILSVAAPSLVAQWTAPAAGAAVVIAAVLLIVAFYPSSDDRDGKPGPHG